MFLLHATFRISCHTIISAQTFAHAEVYEKNLFCKLLLHEPCSEQDNYVRTSFTKKKLQKRRPFAITKRALIFSYEVNKELIKALEILSGTNNGKHKTLAQ